MRINPLFPYPLYLVISERDCFPQNWLHVAEEAITGGVDLIQLREKADDPATFLDKAIRLKKITDHHGIPLVINDAVEIADQIGAWGVHVGQNDCQPLAIREKYGDKLTIGWSIEDMQQLESQQMRAVDHLGVSPIFSTITKVDTITEWGIEGLKQLRHKTEKPLIAIGRMNLQNAAHAWNAGADSIAVVSAICQSQDPRAASAQLKELLK
ncbi:MULTISPECIES: thiamine phosphate synthase [Sphingobacterium]|uniref:Thiamine-phosphate synthase n=1 Tax=Sphingobacterium multivorum TaxID=28454 RepID=A0A2X2JGA7_SPHMU|nr:MULTISPECIES: thiamine phosphate synthase [Sphingobacterium]QRQ62562.1 thiamine phosphate synthase [Sphingobacterium multivorum]SPZ92948.1 Thiamine-phosphate synthase [Sphingobacterium multivorum]HAK30171.1 thiamine phosphate synthase [Sphingobacterium sp.]